MASHAFRKLLDRHVLLIGGSSGIGLAVAQGALASDANVTISSSSQARVDAAVSSLAARFPARRVRGVVTDLSRPSVEADLEALFQAAEAELGTVHHVVYTAADALSIGALDTVGVEQIHKLVHMRGVAQIMLAKVAARHLPRDNKSCIVYSGGSVASKPDPGWSMLAFAAGGLGALTRGLAVDLAPIRVNIVQAGYVDTGLWDSMGAEKRAALKTMIEGKMLTGKFAQPEDVAEAYLWLLKDSNVTGTTAATDSGYLIV